MPELDDIRNSQPGESQNQATIQGIVCGISALLRAEQRCHRSVGYKNSVSRFHACVLTRIYRLQQELLNDKYHTQKGYTFPVFVPKYRLVTTTKYKDRIPQTSFILNYFYPYIIPKLINNNFACIKGKGVDLARKTFKKILEKASLDDFVTVVDIHSYFASINHQTLFDIMYEYIDDDWAQYFYADVINSNHQECGIGLGSEIHQLSATTLPNHLDHQLDDNNYVRYMDDFRIVGTKQHCQETLKIVTDGLEKLNLQISPKKTYIQSVKYPIKFLGYTFWKHDNGRVTVKRLPEKIRQERRKLRRMKAAQVPFDRILQHRDSVRAGMKIGCRADLKKFDDYFNTLFKEELKNVTSTKT